MNLLDGMKINNTITNTKGAKYYNTSYDSNLDVFTMLSRYNSDEEIIRLFNNALNENEDLALANLLYILDIRSGKGERRIFKTIFKDLCLNNPSCARRVLPFIGELGRYDYILEGLNTSINDDVISLIKRQLDSDLNSDNPSLLAKWLPSHRTHNKNNLIAKKIINELKISEKKYRQILSKLRTKINIIEKNLTEKKYENIDFSNVPTKAMLRYKNVFMKKLTEKYDNYKEQVLLGNEKINTKGLFVYEIIKNILWGKNLDVQLYDLMWNNQIDVLKGCNTNVLVMADTSGSMTCCGGIPYATSIGLGIYTAERNTGIFKNHFITFSSEPYLCEVKGKNIQEKVFNIPCYVANTDIDKAFELILNTAIDNSLEQKDFPSHLLIISDMEFDQGVYSKSGTNLSGWKKTFKEHNYEMPKIIFWNVACQIKGIPATKFDNDVAMISGFSTNILENILSIEEYSPQKIMYDKLRIYLEMLN